jgi:hypothetical protein
MDSPSRKVTVPVGVPPPGDHPPLRRIRHKALTVGSHEITATYAGNADYAGSEASISQAITP